MFGGCIKLSSETFFDGTGYHYVVIILDRLFSLGQVEESNGVV